MAPLRRDTPGGEPQWGHVPVTSGVLAPLRRDTPGGAPQWGHVPVTSGVLAPLRRDTPVGAPQWGQDGYIGGQGTDGHSSLGSG